MTRAPLASPKKPVRRTNTWSRELAEPIPVVPEHPHKNQARVPAASVQDAPCCSSEGLSVEESEAPEKIQTPLILKH